MKSEEVMCTDPYADRTATCLGDSGGPLTDTTGSTLVGVISFGSGCEADHIPDGHVRISEVHDWIQDQICSLSANKPDSCSGNMTPRDPRAIEVVIDFTHDFYPEHTTFAIRSKETLQNVYAGPEYIPTRDGNHKESLFLLPGEYTFDVFDVEGNGLESANGDGFWKLYALYDGSTETEIANGGPSFRSQQVTKFVVAEIKAPINDVEDTAANGVVVDIVSDEMRKCLDARDSELASPDMVSSTCACERSQKSDEIVLGCFHDNSDREPCRYKYQTCSNPNDCCGERTCMAGKCRSSALVTTGRENNRLSLGSAGGAAAGRSSRGSGNLRRR